MDHITYDTAWSRSRSTDLGIQAPRVGASPVLRTNLQFVNGDADSKVVVVTFSVPEEGKTTIVNNLATTSAQADQRVLYPV